MGKKRDINIKYITEIVFIKSSKRCNKNVIKHVSLERGKS